MKRKFFDNLHKIFGLVTFIAFIYLINIFVFTKPSNSRDWEVGFERLPQITINNDEVTINDLRDYHFATQGAISQGYSNQTVNINDLERVWFVFEPFVIKPFTNFSGVAHTYFVFDFKNQSPVVVSVEARREKGEKYDAKIGLFNQYELIYVWGTEEDETVRRVIVENNKLFMYPLKISQTGGQRLFMQLAQASDSLESTPRFYNTITSNCTNELAKAANLVKPGAIPPNIALYLPGYADDELYKLGFLPNDISFADLQKKYYVSDIIRENYTKKDFSKQLRAELAKKTI